MVVCAASSCGGPEVANFGVGCFPGTGLGSFDAGVMAFCAFGPGGPGRAPDDGGAGSLL